jgi:hypothetical protein
MIAVVWWAVLCGLSLSDSDIEEALDDNFAINSWQLFTILVDTARIKITYSCQNKTLLFSYPISDFSHL